VGYFQFLATIADFERDLIRERTGEGHLRRIGRPSSSTLAEVAAYARHAWEVESTKRNLVLIRKARETRNEDTREVYAGSMPT
jgi:hypothetical protein